ncbi:Mechanosensitive ion channel-domain-containing protein [Irpex rosettiformis]|uniref:Mechanosensitive ion channel-domain-containing protein n=1 Tax=Irpex rosettiformis TaxID=378272 RepID=A0ACB8UFA5_9APHY|nr:Mechanosensitive ion channel-domain-containing protein [Irpex rosettiformis]
MPYSQDDHEKQTGRHSPTGSEHSDSPLNQPPSQSPPMSSYPPMPRHADSSPAMPGMHERRRSRHVRMQDSVTHPRHNMPGPGYDPERSQSMPVPGGDSPFHHSGSRSGSWDLLAGIKKWEHSYEEFDSRNASATHLQFAQGDMPQNKFVKFYNYLLNVSIVTRWFLFIVPPMAIIWIPGILGLTSSPKATIWGVKLIWWSIWLSVLWGGWWAALAASMLLPRVARVTLGLVAFGARRYIDWLEALHRYVAFTGWTLAVWITYQPLILTREASNATDRDRSILSLLAKLFFAFYICALVLLGEKFAIQWIAGKFHERSYAERIADQRSAVSVLSTLYRYSSDIPGRSDTLKDGPADGKRMSVDPRRFFKKALKGVREVATTTTTALGTVASEIAGSSVLQPNSPQAKVQTALHSANKSRLLARRLYYSFVKPHAEYLTVHDIARFFPSMEDAEAAFGIFDKDSNGDVSRDEIELACMEFHREQLSLEHSMQDLDSAVGRLDNILMSVYAVVAILIIAVALEAQLVTLITGAGSFFLGLSWLIGGALSEVLTSIIFLFVKHPYDVGDRICVEKEIYTVKEIRLLSTILLDSNSCYVQAPNVELSSKHIENMRRSPQMSEPFTFDVAYSTSFEQIERLRELMISFLNSERRDFLPQFDVLVVDIPEQSKMTLKADIKYKSNWQQGALKSKRRNKWVCALKLSMAKVKIFGPGGDPDAKAGPTPYTLVPYEPNRDEPLRQNSSGTLTEPRIPEVWTFSDHNAVMFDATQDVFGEAEEVKYTNRVCAIQTLIHFSA